MSALGSVASVRGRRRRRWTIGGALLAAMLVLSGCATIPLSGSVQSGNRTDAEDPLSTVFSPSGPTDGQSATDIVAGFIAAGTGPQDNYKVARQYLSRSFAAQWNPNARVLVHDVATSVLESEGAVQLVVPAAAEIDETGRYTELPASDPVELGFTLVEEDGQWRIAQAADGVVLLRQQFEALFAQRALYFYDPTYAFLVPDLRWFPSTADAPTRIVEALLTGPAEPIAKSVQSAFPTGTRLTRQSVSTTAGVAEVALNDVVAAADTITRQRMKLQLTSALVGGQVFTVRVSVDGRGIAIPDFGEEGPVEQPLVNQRALVLTDAAFGLQSGEEIASVGPAGDVILALQPRAVTMTSAFDLAAVLAPDGVHVVRSDGQQQLVDDRANQIAPTLDGQGFVWTITSSDPTNLRAIDSSSGAMTPIETTWVDATSVQSIAVSRDSTRLLTLLDVGGASVLRVYGIIRDSDGAPFTLSDSSYELILPPGTAVSTTWVDDSTVGTLVRAGEADYRVVIQDLGGRSTLLPRLTDATTLVGGNGQGGLRILTASGDLQVVRGAGWQPVASGVTLLATQR